jgi:hypothetical protein
MHELYKLKEMLCKELEEYGSKGELTGGTLEVVDKLAHALKNLERIIESKEMEDEYSMEGAAGGSYARMSNARGQRYSRDGGNSYARGRGRNARRDSMGRYSRNYSYADGMEDLLSEMKEMMGDLPEEKRREVQRFVDKMERM